MRRSGHHGQPPTLLRLPPDVPPRTLAETMIDKRVHIDTLEYTRTGLRTKEPLALQTGEHNRIVLVRPDRQPAITSSFGGFPENLSFPGPAVLSTMLHEHRGGDSTGTFNDHVRGSRIQVFGHADAVGSEAENKALSDRRAKAVHALLIGDAAVLTDLAAEEDWGLDIHQVMLRAVECDPGPIDGVLGEYTEAAVRSFQQKYVDGTFHSDEPPLQPKLAVDGELSDETKAALVEAYVCSFSPRLQPDDFIEPSPANGCASYNAAVTPDDLSNRRVSLVLHDRPLEYPEAIPCTAGDHMACPAVDDGSRQRCMWFREHVVEANIEDGLHHHFRPSWLPLSNGNYLLSVLTTVPDAEEVHFQVMAREEAADGVDIPKSSVHVRDIDGPMVNRPIHGVAQVVWAPPPDFAPGKDGRVPMGDGSYVPVFRASHGASEARMHDSYPATEIVVLFAREAFGGARPEHGSLEFELRHDSGLVHRKPASEASAFDETHFALRFTGVEEYGRYTLEVHDQEGVHRLVFKDVPFAELSRPSSNEASPPSTCQHWLPPEPAQQLDGSGADAPQPAPDGDLLSLL